MIYVLLAEAVALVVLTLLSAALARTIHSVARQAARERDLILNQLLHLAGRTWEPPPSEPFAQEEPVLELVPSPEQYDAAAWDS